MAFISKERQALSKDDIDDVVTSQAEDDSAWEEPIYIKRAVDEAFRSAAGLDKELIEKAVENLNRALEIKRGYER